MKISVFLFLACIISMYAGNSYSQATRLSLDLRETTVGEVLTNIENQSEFYFLYSNKLIDVNRKVSLRVKSKPVSNILDHLFVDTDVRYVVFDRQIILSPEDMLKKTIEQQTAPPQERTITGTVTSADDGSTLPGVNVVVKGTQVGTTTDIDGKYQISVSESANILVFSFIGMETLEIELDVSNIIDAEMKIEILGLEQVVVVGYGTMRKRDLTGAISSVKMEPLLSRPMNDFGDALQGQISGVQVIQHNGAPGSAPTIQVRGLNSITAGQVPLLVIDGVPMESMLDLSTYDPMDIESIEVLKDASAAAIYGSRGGAGVILVTTKTAKPGISTFNVNYTYSVQTLPRKVPVMNAQQYIEASMQAAQNAWVYDQLGDPNAPNTVAARGHIKYTWPQEWDDPNVRASWPSSDKQDEWYRNAPMHKINLSGSGGTERATYYLSASFLDQEGMINNGHHYRRGYLNGKVETKITDWFRAGININNRLTLEENKPVYWVFESHSIEMPPIFPAWTEDGYAGGPLTVVDDSRYPSTTPSLANWEGIYFTTPANPATWTNNKPLTQSNKVLGTIWSEFTLLEGLTFRSGFTYDQNWSETSTYFSIDNNLPETLYGRGSMERNIGRTHHWYFDNLLSFKNTWGIHSVNATAGYVAEKRNYLGFNTSSRYFENDLVPYLSAAEEVRNNNDSESSTTFGSYLARVNYILKDRYMVTGTIRRDGSSRFGTNYKWGNFPSIALGWLLSEETFMSNIDLINNLKIRASYGFTGNDNFGDYVWIPSLSQGYTVYGGQLNTFYQKGNLPNPELRWEKTGQFNVGFDLSVLNNRVSLVADYYKSRTEDLLLNLPISALTGFTSLLQNIGVVQNKGVELNLTTRNVVGQFNWTTVTNFSLNRGKVIDLGPEKYVQPFRSFGGMQVRSYLDEPIFQYYGYDYIGTYRDQADIEASPSYGGVEPGDAKYRDVNGDGITTTADKTLLGNPQPDFIWSMSNTLNWKGFDLSVLLTSVIGGDKVNIFRRRSMWYHKGRNYLQVMENAWTPENPDSYYYKLSVNVTSMNKQPSSYWIDDATYVKLKSVTLGYILPASMTKRIGISSLRVYLNGNNLYSWDDFIGHDPEQGGGGEQHYNRGITHNEYAIPRTYSMGINITF